jgi:hypothetical protein
VTSSKRVSRNCCPFTNCRAPLFVVCLTLMLIETGAEIHLLYFIPHVGNLTERKSCVHMFGYEYRKYKVRQFNSRNSSVKTKFAYVCTSGCCRLRNTLPMKLCTSSDDDATTGNCLENRFPEYLSVTSRCVGCQERQKILCSLRAFLILERAKNCRGLS